MVRPSTEDTIAGEGGRAQSSESETDTLLADGGARGSADASPGSEPSHIGRHLVIERLGAGAMGVVYAAYDPELDRKLAIKLIRPGRQRGESGARMQREAQAMARVSHPNVIAIYDVGTFAEQVFIAMEFVDGHSLRTLLADSPVAEREWTATLALFLQAGEGLAAAHEAGLVHRDFKPDNVLVGQDGRVRVLDFGLARASSEESDTDAEADEPSGPPSPSAQAPTSASDETLAADGRERSVTGRSSSLLSQEMTRVGSLVGTPAYMPPEHLAGRRTDARGDQFSFCVALWEGLYGQRPFAGETLPELFAALMGHTLSEPAAELRGRVPDSVHAALLRGLAADPEARWPDMRALLDALEPPDAGFRRGVVWAMAGLAALLFGLGLWTAMRSTEQPMCVGFDDHLDGVWDEQRREELREAFTGSGRGYAERSADSVVAGLDAWTEDWLAMRIAACEATHLRGDQSEALLDLRMACLDRRLARLDAFVDVLASGDEAVLEQAAVAVSELEGLEACADAEALGAPKDKEQAEAVAALTAELDTLEALEAAGRYSEAAAGAAELAAQVEAADWRPLASRFALLQGRLAHELAKHEEAYAALGEALALALEIGDDHLAAKAAVELVWAQRFAHDSYAQLPLWERLADAELDRRPDPLLEARVHAAMGHALWEQAEYEQAGARFERALELREAALGPDHLLAAESRVDLAKTYAERGDRKRAREIYLDARRRFEAELGPAHPRLAALDNLLGGVAWKLGDYQGALARFRSARDIREAAFGPEHPSLAGPIGNIGATHAMREEYEQALPHFERAIEIMRREGDSTRLTLNLDNLASLHVRLDQHERARPLLREAYEVRKRMLGPEHPDLARSLVAMAQLEAEVGAFERARELAAEAVALREGVEVQPGQRARARSVLAEVLVALGETEGVVELVEAAREDYRLAGVGGDELARFEDDAKWLVQGKSPPEK